MLAAATFIYVTSLYGAAIGFITDPIAALVPSAIMKDPAVTKLVGQITANPIATSVAAAAIGMIISREIMKD